MANPYREIEIQTANPVRLVERMYERALREIHSAREHQAGGHIDSRGRSVSKALAIVSELRDSLDMVRGGEISQMLEAIYVFASERLVRANVHGDDEALSDAIAALEPLHEAWAELARRPIALEQR